MYECTGSAPLNMHVHYDSISNFLMKSNHGKKDNIIQYVEVTSNRKVIWRTISMLRNYFLLAFN